jgi:hypothetical protein
MTPGPQSHAARATDLVALVTFDNEVRENQAVTLESLGTDGHRSRPLNVSLAQGLHLGRRMWVNGDRREVHGIATARDLGARSAGMIDTLIDAGSAGHGDEVIAGLLTQAVEESRRARLTHLLLHTAIDASAREPAMQAGFRPRYQSDSGQARSASSHHPRRHKPGAASVVPALQPQRSRRCSR